MESFVTPNSSPAGGSIISPGSSGLPPVRRAFSITPPLSPRSTPSSPDSSAEPLDEPRKEPSEISAPLPVPAYERNVAFLGIRGNQSSPHLSASAVARAVLTGTATARPRPSSSEQPWPVQQAPQARNPTSVGDTRLTDSNESQRITTSSPAPKKLRDRRTRNPRDEVYLPPPTPISVSSVSPAAPELKMATDEDVE